MVRRWSRRDSVASDVVEQLPTHPGERVLAATRDTRGQWMVGTEQALYLPGDDQWTRIPWQRVDQATWDRDAERLAVVEVADYGEPQPRHEIALADPGRLLELVRERVTASILLSRHVPVPGSDGVQVIARRAPVSGGEVDWSVRLADSLDPSDPDVARAVERAVAEAKAELGA
jgi:hypothetical protein